jgi:membrane protease YdiL (CAAX protease family)
MTEEERTEPLLQAMKLFFIYFFSIMGLTIFTQVLLSAIYGENIPKNTLFLDILLSLSHVALLYFLSKSAMKKFGLFQQKWFEINQNDLLFSLFLGLGLGFLLALITHGGLLFPEKSAVYSLTLEGIKQANEYVDAYSQSEFFVILLFSSIIFTAFRELFFRAILFDIIRKSFKLTKAAVQVSFMFALSYHTYQFQFFDVFNLFIFSVLLSYIYFKTKSLFPAIVAGIAYDLPFFFVVFIKNTEEKFSDYFLLSNSQIFPILLASVITVLGFVHFKNRKIEKISENT